MPSIDQISAALKGRSTVALNTEGPVHAAVALILREGAQGPEVLFIERAHHEEDPWSGDLGFPGGKVEQEDGEARAAAERETREEIGLDLEPAVNLGRLDDLTGAHLPIVVSCFVYLLASPPPPLALNHEVSDAFWFPLVELKDPGRHTEAVVRFRGESFTRPAIDLLGPGRPVLWGITYRLMKNLFALLKD